ncbi:uncharacterized protein LOC122624261 [Drosophila teissieri]|uniref:uncharacterized protein LOC122624261 n=1 Tax=Drosophila teissieri TaxID=7243 RepID=UPI001CBA5653|nr:uncharacterized protein LOC122624261 [Drosophila teissieri]
MDQSQSIQILLAEQMKLGEQIQSTIRNYKKDSAKRKSKPGYFEGRLSKLKLLWDAFSEGENTIKTVDEKSKMEHTYFKRNFFVKIKTMVVQYTAEFNQNLPLLEMNTENVSASPQNNEVKFKYMFREQRILMDRLDNIMDKLDVATRKGLNPIIIPHITDIQSMQAHIYQKYKDPK